MEKIKPLTELLGKALSIDAELLAILVIDKEGLLIAQATRIEIKEALIGAIVVALETTLKKLKAISASSFGSGVLDTDDFRLVFVEVAHEPHSILVMLVEHYTNIDKFIPYAYIIAEKITCILKGRSTVLNIPRFTEDGKIDFTHCGIDERNHVKLLVIGSEKVGKSSLMSAYMNGIFYDDYKPTIGVSCASKIVQISGEVKLYFTTFDIGGIQSFTKIRRFFYKHADAVFVVYDATRPDTIQKAKEWIEESRKVLFYKDIPYILVGNKIDLVQDRLKVKLSSINITRNYNCLAFEVSAKTLEGIDELFTFVVDQMLERKN